MTGGGLPVPDEGDLAERAQDWLAAVVFMQSTGRGSRLAITLAKGAACFETFQADEKTRGYFAGFAATRDDVGRLIALMPIVSAWRHTILFLRGRPTRWSWTTEKMLGCYVRSFEHPDPVGYCRVRHELRSGPINIVMASIVLPGQLPPIAPPRPPTVVSPCKMVGHYQLRGLPTAAEVSARFLSLAIEADLNHCPRFDMTALDYDPGEATGAG